MAVLDATRLSLADATKRIDPDGSPALMAELLTQTNQHIEDMVVKQGNLPTGEQVTVRTGYPTVFYRAINQGVPDSKSTSAQITEGIAMLETRNSIDVKLARMFGPPDEFRAQESIAFIDALGQTQASGLFYGNPVTDPKQYLGFAGRYSLKAAGNGQNILDAGGTGGSMTSIWIVGWSTQSIYTHYPKGLQGGLLHQNLGEMTIQNSDGTKFQAYADVFQWDLGLAVKDWRYAVRIANVDVTALLAGTGTQALTAGTHVFKLMNRGLARFPDSAQNMTKMAIYMNRSVFSGCAIAAMDKSQNVFGVSEGLSQFGTPLKWLTFQGIPIRKVDALLNTETQVT